ncbi:MBL fold metallo-hydrolase [Henriciella aquimarina]|uniref:MBL fold metallo-hydrolase n=1 Tax=Henriciella aquimarina TaxID=545261 RepID=UPI000A03B66A|nr:MBL fold metallo-hydrolase [Henriciella aquimarina]
MFLKQIKTDGLAHFSYIIGDGSLAAVIDPRRDIEVYLETARANGVRIAHIFETHRNEDLVSGACALAEITGAKVYHGPNAADDITYAETVKEGFSVDLGALKLEVMETPGHTDDSISIAIYDTAYPDGAAGVFTGDALFVGDVGRTDFYPDRPEEVAGKLYDSLQKLVSLGDQTILYPAHGAGSACGAGMADREFSTIGHERKNNPRLKISSREAFIEAKVNEHHYQPPYFKLMEQLNLSGAPACTAPAPLKVLPLGELRKAQPDHMLDVRPITSHLGGHVAASQALPVSMITAFGGWFLGRDDKIGLIAESVGEAEAAARHLCRIGFDNIVGAALAPVGMAAGGEKLASIPLVDTEEVAARLKAGDADWALLDVRSIEEFEGGHIPGSKHLYAGDVMAGCDGPDLPARTTVMCGSGARATLAASALKRCGHTGVDVFMGSYQAWTADGRETESGGG